MRYPNDWHLLEKDGVLHALAVDMYKGLSEKEVRQRRRMCGANTIWRVPKTSAWEVAMAAIFDLATLLLIVSAAASALFDKSTEAGALVLILIVGGVLRTVTYVRANRILEERAKEKIPTTSVIRDGRVRLVSASDIVPGDIIFLEQGDTVPCDGRVVAGEDSIVSERGITENKTPVHKFDTTIETSSASGEVPCEFRSNMLFAGSLVLSGSLRMAATACGEATLISRKQGGIQLPPPDKLPLIEKLRVRSKNTSLIMLAFVMLITALSMFMGENTSLPDVFLGTMSMAVASMSEFLTIIGTIMIAVAIRDAAEVSTQSKSTSHAVIRQPEKLEDIRDVHRIVFCGSSFFKSGRSELYAYRAKGEYSLYSRKKTENSPGELLALAVAASAESNTGMAAGASSAAHQTSDITVVIHRALDSYSKKSGEAIVTSYALYDHRNSSDPQTMGMEISLIDKSGDVYAVAVGTIGTVLRCCNSAETSDGTEPLTDALRRKIFTECAELEFSGAQIVAVAVRKSPYLQLNRVAFFTEYMTFVGFFAVAEEPEKNAVHNLAYLKAAGVMPILFTENPDADLYYCHRLGLFNKNTVRLRAAQLTEDIVDSVTASGATDGMIVSFADVSRAYLAAAYSGAMKLIMHNRAADTDRVLQEKEDAAPVTAAVGRETWDSGVLATADFGIAAARSNMRTVPETLSRNAAVLVHKEGRSQAEAGFGGLDGIVRSIKASSRIVINIESAKSYLTAAQCARLIVILAAVLFRIPLISAVFTLIWGILFDFAAVLMMAFETHDDSLPYLRTSRFEAVESVTVGCIWGAILAGYLPLLRLLEKPLKFTMSSREELAVLSSSIILSGVVLAFARMKMIHGRKRLRIHTVGLLFIAASVGLCIALTMTDNSVIGGVFCGWKSLLSFVPAVICLILAEIYGGISRRFSKLKTRSSRNDAQTSTEKNEKNGSE